MSESDARDLSFEAAVAVPTEVGINADGTGEVIYHIAGTSDEAVDEMSKDIEDATGSPVTPVRRGRNKGFAGFTSNMWKASWEPKGPNQSWRTKTPENN